MEYSEKRMHWLYFFLGGFVIGTVASLLFPILRALSEMIWRVFGALWIPSKFLKRCWGYW